MEMDEIRDTKNISLKTTPPEVSESNMKDFFVKKFWDKILPKTSLKLANIAANLRISLSKKAEKEHQGLGNHVKNFLIISVFYTLIYLNITLEQPYLVLSTIAFAALDFAILLANLIIDQKLYSASNYIILTGIHFLKIFTFSVFTLISQIPLALFFIMKLTKEEIIKILFLIKDNSKYEKFYAFRLPENYSSSLSKTNQEFLTENIYHFDSNKSKVILVFQISKVISLIQQDEVIFKKYEASKKPIKNKEKLGVHIEKDMQNNIHQTIKELYEKI